MSDSESEGVWFVKLRGRVPGGAGIEFVRADVPAIGDPPCALIHYTVRGESVSQGVRLDLDKQVFLDHLEESEQEDLLRQAAPQLIEIIYGDLEKKKPRR